METRTAATDSRTAVVQWGVVVGVVGVLMALNPVIGAIVAIGAVFTVARGNRRLQVLVLVLVAVLAVVGLAYGIGSGSSSGSHGGSGAVR